MGDSDASARKATRGFTLLELLVSIGVMAIILVILIPLVGDVRSQALEAAVLAHQRETGAELRRYTTDRRGWYPYYGVAGTARAPLDYPPRDQNPLGTGTLDPDGPYWGQPLFWWWKLELDGYDGALARRGPEVDPDFDLSTRPYNAIALDMMMYGAFATPWFFTDPAADDVRQHQPMPEHAVAFPASKGLLLRWNTVRRPTASSQRHFVSFVDGHGERLAERDMIAGVEIEGGMWAFPVLTTRQGVLGRDR